MRDESILQSGYPILLLDILTEDRWIAFHYLHTHIHVITHHTIFSIFKFACKILKLVRNVDGINKI